MSTTLLAEPVSSPAAAAAAPAAPAFAVTEAYYTICPVLVASNVAVEFGWLDEEFARAGAKATYLRSLAENAGWIPHYRHSLNPLFRDGGAYPTIWARADLTDTTLIALTGTQSGGQIVVRVGSGLRRVADLRGRRVGLTRSLNAEKIDFARATSERNLEVALEQAGLGRNDVEWVDLPEEDAPAFAPAARPSALWAQHTGRLAVGGSEVEALRAGRIDAFASHAGRAHALVESGEFTVIADLSRSPDWTAQLANGPFTTAVNTDFAHEHPEVVVAFLRAAIRAGRWINANRAAAADIFRRVTFHPSARTIAAAIGNLDFVPNLSPQNLAATALNKDFLRARGYVRNDFDVPSWADDRLLREAHASLDA